MRSVSAFVGMALAGALWSGPGMAGDNNVAILLQVATGSLGNTLSIDQSGASGSLLAGDLLGATPAMQVGDGNRAAVVVTGTEGSAALMQGSQLTPAIGNSAEVTVAGIGGTAALQQFGAGNIAELDVLSTGAASGSVLQIGSLNDARLRVEGGNVSGRLVQIGNANTNDLTVGGPGAQDISVTFTQIGAGLNNSGAQVFTNAGAVQITQTQFGTFRN